MNENNLFHLLVYLTETVAASSSEYLLHHQVSSSLSNILRNSSLLCHVTIAILCTQHHSSRGLRCQSQTEAWTLATVSSGHMVSVDVDIWEKLEQQTLGNLGQ